MGAPPAAAVYIHAHSAHAENHTGPTVMNPADQSHSGTPGLQQQVLGPEHPLAGQRD